jgi:ribonucleoside-diphosphate reductase beta chain
MEDPMTTKGDQVERTRSYEDWGSVHGLNKEILPWRLYEKAKKLFWDPADIDFTEDAKQWAAMPIDQKVALYGLATGFMVGEEGVTLDILPLVLAIADEGKTEETMFLTTFMLEEAKHVDFFSRWFDAIGVDFEEMDEMRFKWLREQGIEPLTHAQRHYMFHEELPKVMRRLINDRSPKALLDAAVTYNQFVEGCLAIAGYRVWSQMFTEFGVLPGLLEGLELVQRDERRHIAYGTYLCRRVLSAEPGLVEFAQGRMKSLLDNYFGSLRIQGYDLAGSADPDTSDGNGQAPATMMTAFMPFIDHVMIQVERRTELLAKASQTTADEVVSGSEVEEQEAELEKV